MICSCLLVPDSADECSEITGTGVCERMLLICSGPIVGPVGPNSRGRIMCCWYLSCCNVRAFVCDLKISI
jgi:hypothetical protein